MKSRKAIDSLTAVEDAARSYLTVKEAKEALEVQCDGYKRQIMDYLATATPTAAARLAGREFYICEATREQFALSRARQTLGDETLRPFIRVVTSKSLRSR